MDILKTLFCMSSNFGLYLGHCVDASWRLDGYTLSRKFTCLDSNSEHSGQQLKSFGFVGLRCSVGVCSVHDRFKGQRETWTFPSCGSLLSGASPLLSSCYGLWVFKTSGS